MTKPQFIATFGAPAAELSGSALFIALTDTAREECPYIGKDIAEPTGIVRNEGKMQGWMECLRFLKTVHVPAPTRPEIAPRPQYVDPHAELNPPKK